MSPLPAWVATEHENAHNMPGDANHKDDKDDRPNPLEAKRHARRQHAERGEYKRRSDYYETKPNKPIM